MLGEVSGLNITAGWVLQHLSHWSLHCNVQNPSMQQLISNTLALRRCKPPALQRMGPLNPFFPPLKAYRATKGSEEDNLYALAILSPYARGDNKNRKAESKMRRAAMGHIESCLAQTMSDTAIAREPEERSPSTSTRTRGQSCPWAAAGAEAVVLSSSQSPGTYNQAPA